LSLKAYSVEIEFRTHGPMKYYDLTNTLYGVVAEAKIDYGVIEVHAVGATPALVLAREEILGDLDQFIKEYIPITGWKHGNAYAHLRSALLGTHQTIPVVEGAPVLDGLRLYFLETRPVHNHRRKVLFYVSGKELINCLKQ